MRSKNYSAEEYQRSQAERSQRETTRLRRDGRSRRKRNIILAGIAFLILLVGALPSLITHSPIASSLLASNAAGYGLDASADSIRIGWMTPLRVSGLRVVGESGQSEITIEQLDAPYTITDVMGSLPTRFGEIIVRGLQVDCQVDHGTSSLERDLEQLLGQDSSGESQTGTVLLQDVDVNVTDAKSGETWKLTQASAEVHLSGERIAAKLSGMMTDPNQHSGSVETELTLADNDANQWEISCITDSLPLSGMSLVRRRFPDMEMIPQSISGDATGGILLVGRPDGAVEATLTAMEIRNLKAVGLSSNGLPWQNHLASIEGHIVADANRVIGKAVKASTDFAVATFDGSVSSKLSLAGSSDNFLKWLDEIDGQASARVDLARLDQSLPGILPIRDTAELQSGTVSATVQSVPGQSSFRSQMILRSDAIRAVAGNRNVVIEPVEINATVAKQDGVLGAEKFEWKSVFGNAVGSGNLESGNARLQIDFSRLMSMLNPILNVSDFAVEGIVDGDVKWNAQADRVWKLAGNGNATNLKINLPAGQQVSRASVAGQLNITGRWGDNRLDEISQASLKINSPGVTLQANLQDPVQLAQSVASFPIAFSGSGQAATLRQLALPWMPPELTMAEGQFDCSGRSQCVWAGGEFAAARLTELSLELTDPALHYNGTQFSQSQIIAQFSGEYAWPGNTFRTEKLTLSGDAVSLAAKGTASPESVNLDLAFRTDLNRLQGSVVVLPLEQTGIQTRTVSYRYRAPSHATGTKIHGKAEGQFWITGPPELLAIRSKIDATDIYVDQPSRSASGFSSGPLRQGFRIQNNQPNTDLIWSEPRVNVESDLRFNSRTGQTLAPTIRINTDWLATTLGGELSWPQNRPELNLDGQARMRMDQVAQRLTTLSGSDIRAVGDHETPITLRCTRDSNESFVFDVAGNLGWSEAEVGGIRLGRSKVPFTMDEHTVSIERSSLPIGGGSVNVAGQVHYAATPKWIQVPAGRIAQSVELTPDMTRKWLKFIAPIAADATQVNGRFSLDLDEAIIVVDSPEQTRIRGKLEIENAQIAAGPLANQVIGGIRQLKTIAALGTAPPQDNRSVTFVTLRPQTVDFALIDSVVSHQRLFFDVDRAEVVTSGNVSLDGRLALAAQVPLNSSWLGRDLKSMAGQQITLPVSGTFANPNIDASAIRDTATQFGKAAVQSAVQSTVERSIDGMLKDQLNKGQQEISRGLQGLGLDKLFGN